MIRRIYLAIAERLREYAKSGYHAALFRMIELDKDLAKRRYVDPGGIAYTYAELGDPDQAFRWLDKAYSERSESLQVIKIVRQLDRYRSDPRYIDLLKRMALP